jgi:hypothetical protein
LWQLCVSAKPVKRISLIEPLTADWQLINWAWPGGTKKKACNKVHHQQKHLQPHEERFEEGSQPLCRAKKLKSLIIALQYLVIRQIQRISQKTLALPSRKTAAKPIFTEGMKKKRISLTNQYHHWKVSYWKKVIFSDVTHWEFNTLGGKSAGDLVRSDRFAPKFTRKTVRHPCQGHCLGCLQLERLWTHWIYKKGGDDKWAVLLGDLGLEVGDFHAAA